MDCTSFGNRAVSPFTGWISPALAYVSLRSSVQVTASALLNAPTCALDSGNVSVMVSEESIEMSVGSSAFSATAGVSISAGVSTARANTLSSMENTRTRTSIFANAFFINDAPPMNSNFLNMR